MKNYYKYNINNGEITEISKSTHEQTNVFLHDNEEIVYFTEALGFINFKSSYHNLETNMLTNRPDIECLEKYTVSTVESIIISDLPNSTVVILDDIILATIDTGTLELTIPVSGIYTLKLEPPFPYVEKEIQVEVS